MLTDDTLAALDTVAHGFMTRRGGVSPTPFDSLNCGFGASDAPDNVARNRALAMDRLGFPADALATCFQIHSTVVVEVERPWHRDCRPRADALVSRQPGIALGILTADCAPVLFADPDAHVVGAAHAGWRGALDGVLEATVAAMEGLGARRARIRAAIGPCIGRASYEVGPEFPGPFLDQAPDNDRFFWPAERRGHFLFDLAGYAANRLERLGLASVATSGRDTCAEELEFYSYRRACRRGEADYGRLLSVIALKE
jgi:YfiH family protein